jgi:hypothetical protein
MQNGAAALENSLMTSCKTDTYDAALCFLVFIQVV